MEAIYLITPNEKTVKELMSDFQSQHRTQYRAAHVYFTEGKKIFKSKRFHIKIDRFSKKKFLNNYYLKRPSNL